MQHDTPEIKLGAPDIKRIIEAAFKRATGTTWPSDWNASLFQAGISAPATEAYFRDLLIDEFLKFLDRRADILNNIAAFSSPELIAGQIMLRLKINNEMSLSELTPVFETLANQVLSGDSNKDKDPKR